MPLSTDTKWVHSSSIWNKNPDMDLGGVPSTFELSLYPMNNLFDNLLPAEVLTGLVDYRCFYILNKDTEKYIRDVTITLHQISGGSNIEFGSILADDQQQLIITPLDPTQTPDNTGYIIVDPKLGPPITVYWNGSISAMATDFQTKLNGIPLCDGSSVSGTTLASGWELLVTFSGDAGLRFVPNITVIANRLTSTAGGFFRVFPAPQQVSQLCPGESPPIEPPPYNPPWEAFRDSISIIPIYPVVSPTSFPPNGPGFAFNKCLYDGAGGFQNISYTSLAPTTINGVACMNLTLNKSIGYPIEVQDEVYIAPKDNNKFIVAVSKVTAGGPINTIAQAIPVNTQMPNNVSFGTSLSIPWLKPLEGFPIWVQRSTTAGTPGMLYDGFSLSFTGSVYS